MLTRPIKVCASAAVVATSPRPLPSSRIANSYSAQATSTCQNAIPTVSIYGRIDSVSRAEVDSAATIASWQEDRVATMIKWVSPMRTVSASESWTVCLYQGQFVTPVPPPLDGVPRQPASALRVLISPTGEASFDSSGYINEMSPDTPADWLASHS